MLFSWHSLFQWTDLKWKRSLTTKSWLFIFHPKDFLFSGWADSTDEHRDPEPDAVNEDSTGGKPAAEADQWKQRVRDAGQTQVGGYTGAVRDKGQFR